jgi:hypothetical protein
MVMLNPIAKPLGPPDRSATVLIVIESLNWFAPERGLLCVRLQPKADRARERVIRVGGEVYP